MQITDVRIRKIEKEGKMKAVVSITIDEEFVIHDIKIIEGEKGMFIKSSTRELIQNLILQKYNEELLHSEAV